MYLRDQESSTLLLADWLTVTNVRYPVLENIPKWQKLDCMFYIDPQASGAHWNEDIIATAGNILEYYAPAD